MSEKSTGGGKPSGCYAGRYRNPETGAVGAEVWLDNGELVATDHVVIVGRNGVDKGAGIIKRGRVRQHRREG